LAKLAVQRIKVNILHRGAHPLMVSTLAASSSGLADALPIGGPVAGATETGAVDKTFQQMNRVTVFELPILA
jgi:hypothetical protein